MVTLAKAKLRLRINHSLLDSEITGTIAAAKQELARVGIDTDVDDDLVDRCILTFILREYCGDKSQAEGYDESFKYQLDCLRKSTNYCGG